MDLKNSKQELDFIDMFWEWLSHWKSLMVIAFIGILVGTIVIYCENKLDIELENDVQESERVSLQGLDRLSVDNLFENYTSYMELKEEYDEKKTSLELSEKAETLEKIAETEYYIEYRKNCLTEPQKEYYCFLIGFDTSTVEKTGRDIGSITKGVLVILSAMFMHFFVFFCLYIFDKKLKPSDDLSGILNCVELLKCIDWNNIDSKKGFNKIVAKCRVSKGRRIELLDTEKINSVMIVEMANGYGIKSLVIVSEEEKDAAYRLKSVIDKENNEINVRVVNSLIFDAVDAKLASKAEGAVILTKIGQTNVSFLREEAQILANRNIKLLGAVMYI